MKSHQRVIREALSESEERSGLFGAWWEEIDTARRNAVVRQVPHDQAESIILKYEWLGTMPASLTAAFGIFFDGTIAGVECFTDTKPASKYSILGHPAICLCRGACAFWAPSWAASALLSESVRLLDSTKYAFAIAYADTDAGEYGTVYQAASWTCVGEIANRFWLSPEGQRFDKSHHRDRCRQYDGRKSGPVKKEEADKRQREMLASGWKLMKGGPRYRYAKALGGGRVRKKRNRIIETLRVPYPKRPDDGAVE